MSSPLVSIITPTYNHSKYISECIESVLAQTYLYWEMIVVNDGSTDNTTEKVLEYTKKDDRIRLINQKNIGIFKLHVTYNKALKESKGDYIAILEGDDVWEKDKLEKQVEIFENDPKVILTWGKAYSKNADFSQVLGVHPNIINNDSFLYNKPIGTFLNYLLFENPIVALTICVKKSSLIDIGGFCQDYDIPTVDLPTLLRLSQIGEFYFEDSILGIWRNTASQVTKSLTVEMTKRRKELVFFVYENLSQGNYSAIL